MSKILIDSNNKVITLNGKALQQGEIPDVTFAAYSTRVTINNITQSAITDTIKQVTMLLTVNQDLTTSQNTLLNITAPSGYTFISTCGLYTLNGVSSAAYTVSNGNNILINFNDSVKAIGDIIKATFTMHFFKS